MPGSSEVQQMEEKGVSGSGGRYLLLGTGIGIRNRLPSDPLYLRPVRDTSRMGLDSTSVG